MTLVYLRKRLKKERQPSLINTPFCLIGLFFLLLHLQPEQILPQWTWISSLPPKKVITATSRSDTLLSLVSWQPYLSDHRHTSDESSAGRLRCHSGAAQHCEHLASAAAAFTANPPQRCTDLGRIRGSCLYGRRMLSAVPVAHGPADVGPQGKQAPSGSWDRTGKEGR